MTARSRNLSAVCVLLASLTLMACSSGPKGTAGVASGTPTSVADIDAIAGLLDRGERKDAKKQLDSALKRDPMNPSLLVLRQGMTGDAKVDLGPQNYPYTVKSGETMPDLAQRFLGNRLKAYQLARYNDIEGSSALTAGQIIRIPGQPPRAAPVPRTPVRSGAPAPTTPRAKSPGTAATPAPAPRSTPANPAAAGQARSAGLAALNQGNVASAVALLRRAVALDPGNPAIARDLARAERIAATVRARR